MHLRIVLFIGVLACFGCQNSSEKDTAIDTQTLAKDRTNHTVPDDSGIVEVAMNREPEEQDYDWKQEQDSLREIILSKKTNAKLKTGLFEELYIRDIVREANDTLYFEIGFDRHEFMGCMAPDGYTTHVSFHFPAGEKPQFPDAVYFREHEVCSSVEESNIIDEFQRVESGNDCVTYYSQNNKRTLLIDENNIYYFVGAAKDEISARTLREMLSTADETTPTSKLPYQSTRRTCGYEDFLQAVE